MMLFSPNTLVNPLSFFDFFVLQELFGGSSLIMLTHLMCTYLFILFTGYFIYSIIQEYLCNRPFFLGHDIGSSYDQGIVQVAYNLEDEIRQT